MKTLPIFAPKRWKVTAESKGHLYWPLAMATSLAYFCGGFITLSLALF